MPFDAGTILGHLTLDRTGFTAGMMEASSLTQGFGVNISAFLSNPLAGVANLAREAWGEMNRLSEVADDIGKRADRLGMAAGELSKLEGAARLADVEANELAQALAILSRNAADAADGNKQAQQSFTRLGVSVVDASGELKRADVILADVAEGLAALPNATARTAAAMDLLGRNAGVLNPLLKEGAAGLARMRQEASGLVMTEEQIQRLSEFNDQMKVLKMGWEQMKVEGFGRLLADAQEMATAWGDIVSRMREALGIKKQLEEKKQKENWQEGALGDLSGPGMLIPGYPVYSALHRSAQAYNESRGLGTAAADAVAPTVKRATQNAAKAVREGVQRSQSLREIEDVNALR